MEDYNKDYFWEIYLRDNPLTKDDQNDCIAEVKTGPKTLTTEDSANEIKRSGSELKKATILSVVQQDSDILFEALLNGNSVITDLFQITPRVLGNFANSEAPFDANYHKLAFDVVPTKKLREALKHVKVINLGAKGDVTHIGIVTDTLTDLTDGTITPNDDIRVEGSRIRVSGDAPEVGVYFVPEDGKAPIKVTRKLTQNDPKQLLVRVPALPDGKYTLRIVTQYSNSTQLLKEPRTIEYKRPLVVGNIDDDDDRPVIE